MRCLILALAVIRFVRANDDCHYPFVARGVTYTEGLCADGYWCSRTENWDKDHQSVYNCKTNIALANPDAAVSDVETTVEGVFCTFPFHYYGVIYEECIGTGSSAWCSLTADYSADYKMGYCKLIIGGIESDIVTTGGTAQGAKCVFPFMMNGKLYEDCKMGWCATTENYDTDKKYGYCPRPWYIAPVAVAVEEVAEEAEDEVEEEVVEDEGEEEVVDDVVEEVVEEEVVEEEVEVAAVDEVRANDDAAVSDVETTVEGVFCTFPFHYNGVIYEECIGTGLYAWCSLTADYSADYKRGYCKLVIGGIESDIVTTGGTAQGAKCVFPFMMNGKLYEDCKMGWCATTENYDTDKKYGYCPRPWYIAPVV